MFKCNCGKEFEKSRQLNGHKSIHRVGGRYSVSRIKPKDIIEHPCLNCKKMFIHSHRTLNMYCSNSCQQIHAKRQRIENWLKTGTFSAISVTDWVKNYLYEIRGKNCEICSTGYWNGVQLPLECDHIDGNSENNHIDNLRLICPNCHSLTPTFKGKNKGNGRKHRYKNKKTQEQFRS